jgi:hypothetical protein
MPESLKYSSVDGVDIYIDYVVPESATKEKPAPIFLWFVSGFLVSPSSLCSTAISAPKLLVVGPETDVGFLFQHGGGLLQVCNATCAREAA